MIKMLSGMLLGDVNGRELKRHLPVVEAVNALGDQVATFTDEQLRQESLALRQRAENGEPLDEFLVEAFTYAREACARGVGMRPYDVQVLGACVLNDGRIAEMKTGEGKTMVAVLPAYLNALDGKGVHIVSVNDYLVQRDRDWMAPAYELLGLQVGAVTGNMETAKRREAYACDVTYITNNEAGFDYLRDNMVVRLEDMVQRGHHFAIVDEVDSVLIDEARTPLIISGAGDESTELYQRFAQVVPNLVEGEDYTKDEKAKTVAPTEAGVAKVERAMGVDNLYADARTDLSHYLMQALKAHALMKKDRDYVVKDGEVLIVDEFTGRLMFGRRYSDGLHQAIEAKENVKVASENVTLATITFQNFFRMYDKLSGMTGTAVTEEEEFRKIYRVSVVAIPTHMPMIRDDMADLVYKREEAKFAAVVEDIVARHETGQPVLVGTISIEKSEHLSRLLDKRGVTHQVLNAKQHEKEAGIIAGAGQMGAVTIATNMAGRGTDIKLGDGVPALGGLHVLGTERHESRRIDNQLRGRSGRQGDPGSSQFYVSLEDDLMRIFGGENLQSLMDRLGLPDDEAIQHTILTRSIERAQKRVESRNFDMRKHLLDYDDVMNTQRAVVYGERQQILDGTLDLRERMLSMIAQEVEHTVDLFEPEQAGDEWNLKGMLEYAEANFLNPAQITEAELDPLSGEEIEDLLQEKAVEAYEKKEHELTPELLRQLERLIALRVVDEKWIAHMQVMDEIREGIGLRAYGQLDPLVAYKQEAFAMFQQMTDAVRQDMVRFVLKVQVNVVPQTESPSGEAVHPESPQPMGGQGVLVSEQTTNPVGAVLSHRPLAPETTEHVGRNDPCPCGSGKKYKRCHGRASA